MSADTDSHFDLYERSAGVTTLISTSDVGGNGPADAWFEDASEDGTRVLFRTDEQLSASDLDATYDIYERFDGSTTLISTGPAGGNGPFYPFPNLHGDVRRCDARVLRDRGAADVERLRLQNGHL